MSVGLKRAGKLVVCAAIAVAAAVTLGLSVDDNVRFNAAATTPEALASDHATLQQLECIYNAIRSQVPKGAPVYTKDSLWAHQRLSELSTLWVVPQAKKADAQYWLTLVSARGHCDGLELKVSRI